MALFHGKAGILFLNGKIVLANFMRLRLFVQVTNLILYKITGFTEREFYSGLRRVDFLSLGNFELCSLLGALIYIKFYLIRILNS